MALDISQSLIANSDQLNAADIVAGPITVQITGVAEYKDEKQPYAVKITGHKPWIPCKGMRRLIAAVWGVEASAWVGRTVRLYNEPTATFGSDPVGGIRVSGLSHIDKSFTATVPDSVTIEGRKKKTATYRVERLTPTSGGTTADPVAAFRAVIGKAMKDSGWTEDQVRALLGGRKAAELDADERNRAIAALKGPPPGGDGPTPEEQAEIERMEREQVGDDGEYR